MATWPVLESNGTPLILGALAIEIVKGADVFPKLSDGVKIQSPRESVPSVQLLDEIVQETFGTPVFDAVITAPFGALRFTVGVVSSVTVGGFAWPVND